MDDPFTPSDLSPLVDPPAPPVSVRRVVVAAGPIAVVRTPVEVEPPDQFADPALYRAGRQAPLASQTIVTPAGRRTTWLIGSAAADELHEFHLADDRRKRSSVPRVTLAPRPGLGWVAAVVGRPVAAFQCPPQAAVSCSLTGPPRYDRVAPTVDGKPANSRPFGPTVAVVRYRPAGEPTPENRLRVVRTGPPTIVEGRVFAKLTTDAAYVDAAGRTLFVERCEIVVWDGDEAGVGIDLSVGWHAATGPFVLASSNLTAGVGQVSPPEFEIKPAGRADWRWATLDLPRVATQPAGEPTVAPLFLRNLKTDDVESTVAVDWDPAGDGWPASAVQTDAGVLRLRAARPRADLGDRLPLGESRVWRLRFAALRTRRPGETAAGWFLSRRRPPSVEWFDETVPGPLSS
ncbi:MAG: hypothetical protein ACRC1K_24435 [Planctomycetia bacterium]